jgi:hypothetical protein
MRQKKGGASMRRTQCVAFATVLIILGSHGSALAGGVGPYFSWGREEPSGGLPGGPLEDLPLPPELEQALKDVDIDMSLDHLTFGVIYDSAPARDKLMSYRGTLGFDISTGISVENINVLGLPIDVGGLALGVDETSAFGFSSNHTLAFGIIRTDRLKWWAGPGIGLSFNYYDVGTVFDIKAANVSIGGGGETGVNIHFGSNITLCVGGGIHWRAFAYGGDAGEIGSLVWGNGPMFFIQTSLLFRTGADRS